MAAFGARVRMWSTGGTLEQSDLRGTPEGDVMSVLGGQVARTLQ